MTGYARTGGNLKGKRKPRKTKKLDLTANGQHFDPRMQIGIADIKRMYPELCAVPKSVRLASTGK